MPAAARWSRFLDLIVVNWPLKVTALALAAILWVAVAAEEPATERVDVDLKIRLPEGRALTRPVPAVTGVFAGPARELLKLYANPPVIHLAIPDSADSVFSAPLSPAVVEMPRHVEARPQAIEPHGLVISLQAKPRTPAVGAGDGAGTVTQRVLMGVPVTLHGDRAGPGWASEPPAVIVTVRGPSERLARLTRDSVEVAALPAGGGRPETVHLQVLAPAGIDAAAIPDTAIVQRRGRA